MASVSAWRSFTIGLLAGPAADEQVAVGGPVTSRRHVHAAEEAAVEREEAVFDVVVGPGEDLDVRAAAGPGPGDDVGLAVAVHVADGHVDAAP